MSLRTPIGRARGFGSSQDGTHHWWHQILTAVALLPLSAWFVISLVALSDAPYEEITAWLASPVVAGLMLVLIYATFYHLKLGLQVMIDDYVHTKWRKFSSQIALLFGIIVLGLTCMLAVLWTALGA
jgi:succinate dehydrogenase / fumarate reductase membrane anchor subunit